MDDLIERLETLAKQMAMASEVSPWLRPENTLAWVAASALRAAQEREREYTEALIKIAGGKNYSDDPWSIARALLEKHKPAAS